MLMGVISKRVDEDAALGEEDSKFILRKSNKSVVYKKVLKLSFPQSG